MRSPYGLRAIADRCKRDTPTPTVPIQQGSPIPWSGFPLIAAEKRIRDLEAALKAFADMWNSNDSCSTSKRAQAKRAAMWDLYHKAMGEEG